MAEKPLYLDPTTGQHAQKEALTSSVGSANAGRVIATGADGLIDPTLMPSGIGASTEQYTASENISAGALVNFWVSGGNARVRNADASTAKPADGFVLAAVTSGNVANVYRSGRDTALTGMTVGDQFLSTTPGQPTTTQPTGSGQIVQRVGFAGSATALAFSRGAPVQLA